MKPLPIAIINPHSGLAIPPELAPYHALSAAQIFNEADAYIDQIFDFRERVLYHEAFPYARALVDVNRPSDPTLHHRPGDGVLKEFTSYGTPTFQPNCAPDQALNNTIITRYWQPWHDRLARIAADERVKLVLDCHSMAAVGPQTYGDHGTPRPRALVGNLGTVESAAVDPNRWPWISASPSLTKTLAMNFQASLADFPAITAVPTTVAVNKPYWGGWDIRLHAEGAQPWLMVELNRGLYVGEQTGDSPERPPDLPRIVRLREQVWEAIEVTLAWLMQQ